MQLLNCVRPALGMGNNWVNNSFHLVLPPSLDLIILAYVTIPLGTLILFHSLSTHKCDYDTVRICTEISVCGCVILSSCFLTCLYDCSKSESAYLVNLISSLAYFAVQFSDNYFSFYIYRTLSKYYTSGLTTALFFLWTFSLLYLSWLSYCTIQPVFFDTNNPNAIRINYIIGFVLSSLFSLTYNLLFMYLAAANLENIHIMNQNNQDTSYCSSSSERLAIKAILHNMLSTIGTTFRFLLFPTGVLIHSLIIMLSLHILFNNRAVDIIWCAATHRTIFIAQPNAELTETVMSHTNRQAFHKKNKIAAAVGLMLEMPSLRSVRSGQGISLRIGASDSKNSRSIRVGPGVSESVQSKSIRLGMSDSAHGNGNGHGCSADALSYRSTRSSHIEPLPPHAIAAGVRSAIWANELDFALTPSYVVKSPHAQSGSSMQQDHVHISTNFEKRAAIIMETDRSTSVTVASNHNSFTAGRSNSQTIGNGI